MMCSTDEEQWQESGWNGASVLQEAPHLRQLLPSLDRAPAAAQWAGKLVVSRSERIFGTLASLVLLFSLSFAGTRRYLGGLWTQGRTTRGREAPATDHATTSVNRGKHE